MALILDTNAVSALFSGDPSIAQVLDEASSIICPSSSSVSIAMAWRDPATAAD